MWLPLSRELLSLFLCPPTEPHKPAGSLIFNSKFCLLTSFQDCHGDDYCIPKDATCEPICSMCDYANGEVWCPGPTDEVTGCEMQGGMCMFPKDWDTCPMYCPIYCPKDQGRKEGFTGDRQNAGRTFSLVFPLLQVLGGHSSYNIHTGGTMGSTRPFLYYRKKPF